MSIPEPQTPEPAQPEPQTPEPVQPEPQTPEPANPYQSIIDQQQAQITALIEQTKSLNEQIVSMVQNGAQFNSGQQVVPPIAEPAQQFNPASLSDDNDYSLEALGKEIGKRSYD